MTEFVNASDGARLVIYLDGPEEAPPLFLSNSLGTDHSMWAPQVAALSDRFRIVSYDARGHGRSSAPDGPYTLERLSLDLLEIADSLGWSQFDLAGVSMGGMVGLWLAQNRRERLRRVIVANAGPYANGPAAWVERMTSVREHGMQSIADVVLGRWFTPSFAEGHPELVAALKSVFLDTPPAGYLGSCAALSEMDLRLGLGDIDTPLLWIAGEADVAPPLASVQAFVGQVPSGQLLTLPAAHLSNLEAEAAFTRAIEEFFA